MSRAIEEPQSQLLITCRLLVSIFNAFTPPYHQNKELQRKEFFFFFKVFLLTLLHTFCFKDR